MALAAYNVGLGHLEDARVLTERQDGNPNLWKDVMERLPLLQQSKFYKTIPITPNINDTTISPSWFVCKA